MSWIGHCVAGTQQSTYVVSSDLDVSFFRQLGNSGQGYGGTVDGYETIHRIYNSLIPGKEEMIPNCLLHDATSMTLSIAIVPLVQATMSIMPHMKILRKCVL